MASVEDFSACGSGAAGLRDTNQSLDFDFSGLVLGDVPARIISEMWKHGGDAGLRFRRDAVVEFGFAVLLVNGVKGLHSYGYEGLALGDGVIANVESGERQNQRNCRDFHYF
jgi:hypothetical protein